MKRAALPRLRAINNLNLLYQEAQSHPTSDNKKNQEKKAVKVEYTQPDENAEKLQWAMQVLESAKAKFDQIKSATTYSQTDLYKVDVLFIRASVDFETLANALAIQGKSNEEVMLLKME